MFEIKVTLTADPKLETLLDKLCNALDLGDGLPFTASQIAPAKPAPAVPTAVPAATATAAARAVPVNPTPATPVATTAPIAQPAIASDAPTAMPANTTLANASPVMTQPVAPAADAAPQQTAVPTAAPTYTLEQVQAAVGPLLMQGKGPQMQALLAQFGVQRLPDIPAESLGSFATALRGLGAQI